MTSTTHGAPVWIDLSTHDLDAAKTFYADMFGWDFTDQGQDFGHYHIIRKGDQVVGGAMSSLMGMDGPTDEPQGPTAWGVFLGVDDIHAAAKAVPEYGGQLVVEPMQVGEMGWMAIAIDPAGAQIGMWQSDDVCGAHTTSEPGLPCWFETMSTDYDAAKAFYAGVFGWQPTYTAEDGSETAVEPAEGFRYATNFSRERVSAGLCDAAQFTDTSFWRVYILVADVDAAVAKIQELGGTLIDGPQDSPFGRLATVTDPQGAMLQVLSG